MNKLKEKTGANDAGKYFPASISMFVCVSRLCD